MKSQEEIDKQIADLKEIKKKVRPCNAFGDDIFAQIDAQIMVIDDILDEDDIWNLWPEEVADMHVRSAADEALNWLEDASEYDNLTEGYTLEKN